MTKIAATQFFFRLCSDVFLEVLRSGNRRQLAKLEKIGRYFRYIIDGSIEKAPFLRLDLQISPWFNFILIKFGHRDDLSFSNGR